MSALSTLHAVDRVTAHLCAELRARATVFPRLGTLVLLKDVPAQYRAALLRQGVRDIVTVGNEPALKLEQVEAWLGQIKNTFHYADAVEKLGGVTWLRRFAFAGIHDGQISKRESTFAQEQAEKNGVGPLMTLVAQQLGLPLLPVRDGIVRLPPAPAKVLPRELIEKLLADQRIDTHEVWQLAHRVRLNDPATSGREALQAFRRQHAASFSADARAALDEYLTLGPVDNTVATTHVGMASLWQQTRAEWQTKALEAPAPTPSTPPSDYTFTKEQGVRVAEEIRDFFKKYPSTGGRQLSAFCSGWAINETFHILPIIGYDYASANPVCADGKPRGPLWRAYVAAVRSAAPREVIEEAFFRAHIADFKRAVASPLFAKLYAETPMKHRRIVDAYVNTLKSVEADLDQGVKATSVARFYPLSVTRELVRRGTIGMIWNRASFDNGSNWRNPLTREWWFGFWGMLGTFISGHHPKAAKADAIAVDVTPSERLELRQALDLDLPVGVGTIETKAIAGATFAEPPRGDVEGLTLPRYPLAFSDFDRVDPIHAPVRVSGTDGVFQAKELLGVVRQAQSRIRSNLIHEFQRKYPTPMNGLLEYSANMLALTGAYHQHTAYGMVPNFIMPVDNFGRPKTAKWQAYVDAHKCARRGEGPSKETIERLWFEAHMEDFEQLDSPEFRKQAQLFWRDAIRDPALAPLATYFIAMVHGRDVYDQAVADKLPYEEALVRSFDHFRETLLASGTIPFLGEELRAVAKLFTDTLTGQQPDFDARGLPTDRLLTKRMLQGLVTTSGITRTLLLGGVLNKRDADGKHIGVHTVTDKLLDLGDVLEPHEMAKVDPSVVDYYANPNRYRGMSRIEVVAGQKEPTSLFDFMAQTMNLAATKVSSHVGGAVLGTSMVSSGEFPIETELLKDREGVTHWNRYVVGDDGRRKALFMASFMPEKGKIKETFTSAVGMKVPLYFDAEPFKGGVRLRMDTKLSSALVSKFADVAFYVMPAGNGAVNIRGELTHHHLVRSTSAYSAVMVPKDQPIHHPRVVEIAPLLSEALATPLLATTGAA
jgi:hypothetical protein